MSAPEREVRWHDVENGAYAADLDVWRRLADEASGGVLELGCGTGRVALDLARRGHAVCGVDRSAPLVEALRNRAAGEGLQVEAIIGDVATVDLGERRFGLALAPMQLLQLLASPGKRIAALRHARAHLTPGALLAAAIVERAPASGHLARPAEVVPDVRQEGEWVYSSLPLSVSAVGGHLVVERLRQVVSPAGELEEEPDRIDLAVLDASRVEREGREAGLDPAGRLAIAETELHLGSTVVLLRAPEDEA